MYMYLHPDTYTYKYTDNLYLYMYIYIYMYIYHMYIYIYHMDISIYCIFTNTFERLFFGSIYIYAPGVEAATWCQWWYPERKELTEAQCPSLEIPLGVAQAK